jgi:hypothetical protein
MTLLLSVSPDFTLQNPLVLFRSIQFSKIALFVFALQRQNLILPDFIFLSTTFFLTIPNGDKRCISIAVINNYDLSSLSIVEDLGRIFDPARQSTIKRNVIIAYLVFLSTSAKLTPIIDLAIRLWIRRSERSYATLPKTTLEGIISCVVRDSTPRLHVHISSRVL